MNKLVARLKTMDEKKKQKINNQFSLSTEDKNRLVILFAIPSRRLRPHVPYEFDLISFRKNNKSYSFIAIEYLDIIRFRKFGILLNSEFSQTNYLAMVRIRGELPTGFFYWGGTIGSKLVSFLHSGYPWYHAYYQRTVQENKNSSNPIKLFSKAKELSCSLEYKSYSTKINRKAPKGDSTIELVKKPEFIAYEKIDSSKIKAYQIQRTTKEELLVQIFKINPKVLKNMCLLTEEEENKPYAAYFFKEGKTFTGKRIRIN